MPIDEFESESPFVTDPYTEAEGTDTGNAFPDVAEEKEEIECPYCRLMLKANEDGSYQHEFGACQAFFEDSEELHAATEKIVQQQKKKEEQQKAAAEELQRQIEQEKQESLGEYYEKIVDTVRETLQSEIQNSVAVIQRAADDLYNAKDSMLTAVTDISRSSISEKISYYQTKAAETNEGDPKLEYYKDMEARYNKFLIVFDSVESDKKQLQRKIKELADIDIASRAGILEEYQVLLQMIEKMYIKK